MPGNNSAVQPGALCSRRYGVTLLTTFHVSLLILSLITVIRAANGEAYSIQKEDHNHHRLYAQQDLATAPEINGFTFETSGDEDIYTADVGVVGERALPDHTALLNNVPQTLNIMPGETMMYQVERDVVFGPRGDPGLRLPSIPFTDASTRSQLAEGDAPPEEDDEDDLVERSTVEARQKDKTGRTKRVYISINTCVQPTFKKGRFEVGKMPQLLLYVSNSSSNTSPGPAVEKSKQYVTRLTEGFAAMNVTSKDQVYVSVSAPNITGSTGPWVYEVAASVDGYYHGYNEFQRPGQKLPLLLNVDSDSTSALLVTQNLTNSSSTAAMNARWMANGNPFTLFAFPSKNATLFDGMRQSYCGLERASEKLRINSNNTVTTRGLGGLPKGQFYLQNLQSGTDFVAMMALPVNSTDNVIGGGGIVWPNISLSTNIADSSCSLLFNLSFCSEVAYSVPWNPSSAASSSSSLNLTSLSEMYDATAAALYRNFTYSLQQVPCNTTDSARYSLVSGCDDCAAAYKDWLCAVAVPRCQDVRADALGAVAANAAHTAAVVDSMALMPRNLGRPFANGTRLVAGGGTGDDDGKGDGSGLNGQIEEVLRTPAYRNLTRRAYANGSRNALIDEAVRPGPYMEFLPCEDLCFALVRTCPASLGFACPMGDGLRRSYGRQGQCNSPGAVFVRSAAGRVGVGLGGVLVWTAVLWGGVNLLGVW